MVKNFIGIGQNFCVNGGCGVLRPLKLEIAGGAAVYISSTWHQMHTEYYKNNTMELFYLFIAIVLLAIAILVYPTLRNRSSR